MIARSARCDPAFTLQLTVEQSLFDLTNADRAANGVAPLAEDPDLLVIARTRAASQLGSAPLTHYDSDGGLTSVTDDFGLGWAYASARTLRIADGPDEVHRNHIAKLELARYLPR